MTEIGAPRHIELPLEQIRRNTLKRDRLKVLQLLRSLDDPLALSVVAELSALFFRAGFAWSQKVQKVVRTLKD